jgi:serine/threonine protein kinase
MSPTPALPPGASPGDVLAGKYRVERILGAGGMGVVLAAHHVQLDQRVALKFLLPEAMVNPEALGRFLREARAAVRIRSEHVARVTDVGQLESGTPYMVMEYLEGHDLSVWLADHGALPVQQAVDFVLQACEAVAEAHTLGIVHRDLKPANLFCIRTPDGQPSIKVLDFGISKVTVTDGQAMTRTNALIGSPLYMSPEQMMSAKDVDPRADIWSLGVILFELLTGRVPFMANSVPELAVRIMTQPVPKLRSLSPELSEAIERSVARCLERNLDQRFQSVADMAMALQDHGSKRSRVSVDRILDVQREAGLIEMAVPLIPTGGASGGRKRSTTSEPAHNRTDEKISCTQCGTGVQSFQSYYDQAGKLVCKSCSDKAAFETALSRVPSTQLQRARQGSAAAGAAEQEQLAEEWKRAAAIGRGQAFRGLILAFFSDSVSALILAGAIASSIGLLWLTSPIWGDMGKAAGLVWILEIGIPFGLAWRAVLAWRDRTGRG